MFAMGVLSFNLGHGDVVVSSFQFRQTIIAILVGGIVMSVSAFPHKFDEDDEDDPFPTGYEGGYPEKYPGGGYPPGYPGGYPPGGFRDGAGDLGGAIGRLVGGIVDTVIGGIKEAKYAKHYDKYPGRYDY